MMLQKLKHFINPFDGRYEDLRKGNIALNVLRDFTAGLVVAMVAIPLAMGFAMASGLRPEQGIVGGAVAGAVGALWGGSKYQVYGPTAAFIPVIAGIMATHDHRFLVLVSVVAALILIAMAFTGAGKIVALVPHSIVVGFTIGIAVTIALSQVGEVLGIHAKLSYNLIEKVKGVYKHIGEFNVWAVVLALGTLVLTRKLLKTSVFIPAPLIALAIGALLAMSLLSGEGLTLISTKYGSIPGRSWAFTPPIEEHFDRDYFAKILYFAITVVFVAAIESLLCSRMGDRLAGNKGKPYDPNKELWGQGLVMLIVPLLNGFPHTGALARTATNIKLGAVSPLAGLFKCTLKLLIAYYLARYLELVPMACIGGILLYVAMNMVKPAEVTEVLHMGRGHVLLMLYTATTVILTDFLTGVLSALAIYLAWRVIVAAGIDVAHDPVLHNKVRAPRDKMVRAVLHRDRAGARRPSHTVVMSSERRKWMAHIRQRASISPSAFVHSKASVIGRVVLGDHVHIAASASVRADEGSPFFIGANSNIQDGVIIHALKDRHVRVGGEEWAVYIGTNVSLAHDALIHGPCFVGDDTFVGFKAVVHDSVIGAHCFIGIGAVVVGVEIPSGKYVPPNVVIDNASAVKGLADASEAQKEFNEDVVEVNRGLAAAYQEHHHPVVLRAGPPSALPAALQGHEVGWEQPADTYRERF
ncbi:MAG: hypothetical protein EXR72_04210 [Myxococcales bacterium]|nr:hypothetical protein [Myxococcales bacterium]